MLKYIITADWHLTYLRPKCRLDEDWAKAQLYHITQPFLLAKEHNAEIIHAGDLFDTARQPPEITNLINLAREAAGYEGTMHLLAGNHDLLHHNPKLLNSSSIGIIGWCRGIRLIPNTGEFPHSILVKHILTFPNKESMPKIEAIESKATTAEELLKQYPKKQIIVTGDYHHSFCYRSLEGRMVINPGCLNRQDADMKNYVPSVYLLEITEDIEDGDFKIEPLYIDDGLHMITDDHLKKTEERENRIGAFAERLKTGKKGMTLDYWKNVEKAMLKTEMTEVVKIIINEIREEAHERGTV